MRFNVEPSKGIVTLICPVIPNEEIRDKFFYLVSNGLSKGRALQGDIWEYGSRSGLWRAIYRVYPNGTANIMLRSQSARLLEILNFADVDLVWPSEQDLAFFVIMFEYTRNWLEPGSVYNFLVESEKETYLCLAKKAK